MLQAIIGFYTNMHIPAYQIHHVLKNYSLQLLNAGTASRNENSAVDSSSGTTSPETCSMSVIDKVASGMIQRISSLNTLTSRHISSMSNPAGRTELLNMEIQNNQFVFNTLDIHNIKTSRTLSIENSIFFIKKDPPE